MKRSEVITLCAIALLYASASTTAITWGLPSRNIDPFLFSDGKPWSGEKIFRLAGAGERFAPSRGADIDVDPIDRQRAGPVLLTATDEDVAKIYLRYRLYTYQPDEMITMMALAGMKPGQLDFDPRLYQYGGLFIYPVGALIKLCGVLGIIDVRSDVVYYLDNPDEFGKFYIVARAYSAAWGLLGVIVVFAITRRLGGPRSAWLAALLFVVMPVVVCMTHEGKPHLPGAVLMLMAVFFSMRYLGIRCSAAGLGVDKLSEASTPDVRSRGLKHAAQGAGAIDFHGRDWWIMCICCGAALGMVLSSWPIFVLIPLVAWLAGRGLAALPQEESLSDPSCGQKLARGASRGLKSAAVASRGLKPAAREMRTNTGASAPLSSGRRSGTLEIVSRTCAGVGAATLVYLITNPYILINAIINRDVLRSNFGNSLAMYQIARVGEGFVRVVELTMEGATLPIVVLGLIALIVAIVRRRWSILPLAVPAFVFFLQFVLIGAGKPAEYGRFGIFTNTALAIGVACLLTRRWTNLRDIVNWMPAVPVILCVAMYGESYLRGFYLDATDRGSRATWAHALSQSKPTPVYGEDMALHVFPKRVGVKAEPAPYCFPPFDFSQKSLWLHASGRSSAQIHEFQPKRIFGFEGELWLVPYEVLGNPLGLSEYRNLFRRHPWHLPSVWIRGDPWPSQISWADKPMDWGVLKPTSDDGTSPPADENK